MSTIQFTWSDRDQFVSEVLAAGGSGDVGGESYDGKHLGRYARQYSVDAADAPGRTASLYCARLEGGDPEFLLTGIPWACAADYDAAYELLISAGCTPNDLTESERARAHAARANFRSMADVAALESAEVRLDRLDRPTPRKVGAMTIKIPFAGGSTTDRGHAIAALAATMRPFGSLPPLAAVLDTHPVDIRALGSAEDLASRMLDWIDGRSPSAAGAILATLQGQESADLAAVEFGGEYIQLRTPTSGTTIRLSRQSWCHAIGIVFGAGGSADRYQQISAALAAAGVDRRGATVVAIPASEELDTERALLSAWLHQVAARLDQPWLVDHVSVESDEMNAAVVTFVRYVWACLRGTASPCPVPVHPLLAELLARDSATPTAPPTA